MSESIVNVPPPHGDVVFDKTLPPPRRKNIEIPPDNVVQYQARALGKLLKSLVSLALLVGTWPAKGANMTKINVDRSKRHAIEPQLEEGPKGPKIVKGRTVVGAEEIVEREIGRSKLRELQNQYISYVRDLAAYYVAKSKRPKKPSNRTRNPVYVTQGIQQFFANADLGPAFQIVVDPENPQHRTAYRYSDNLVDELGNLTGSRISCRQILLGLFSIYIRLHNLQEEDNRSYMHADNVMQQYLGQPDSEGRNIFQILASKAPPVSPKTGEVGEVFNPDHFKLVRVMGGIISTGIYKSADLPDDIATLFDRNNAATHQRLEDLIQDMNVETRVVADTKEYYKLINYDADEARKKAKRAK